MSNTSNEQEPPPPPPPQQEPIHQQQKQPMLQNCYTEAPPQPQVNNNANNIPYVNNMQQQQQPMIQNCYYPGVYPQPYQQRRLGEGQYTCDMATAIGFLIFIICCDIGCIVFAFMLEWYLCIFYFVDILFLSGVIFVVSSACRDRGKLGLLCKAAIACLIFGLLHIGSTIGYGVVFFSQKYDQYNQVSAGAFVLPIMSMVFMLCTALELFIVKVRHDTGNNNNANQPMNNVQYVNQPMNNGQNVINQPMMNNGQL